MAYSFKDVSVLIVDDNSPMLELLKSILDVMGFGSIITAVNGKDGFEKFCEYKPDIVIADWMMEPIDGLELVNLIRTRKESPNKFVPYILMTGFSEKYRVFQARDTGVTEFLVKPFSANDLYKRLCQIVENPRQFVDSGEFFGPDRRRQKQDDFVGPFKREDDDNDNDNFKVDV